jgi:hypothetical protein
MSIDNLRADLYMKDLCIDGSREMLIARLESVSEDDSDEDTQESEGADGLAVHDDEDPSPNAP